MKFSLILLFLCLIISIRQGSSEDGRWTELHQAAMEGNFVWARELIERGENVDAKNVNERTPLHVAAQNGKVNVADLLIKHNAYIEAEDEDKRKPLHFAAENGKMGVTELLINYGANVNAVSSASKTPLHLASYRGRLNVADFLIKHGANVNAKEIDKWSPLHFAASYGRMDVADLLIKNGANVNAKTLYKSTPLFFATTKGNEKMIELLLENGADQYVKNDHEKSPKDIADSLGNSRINDLFQKEYFIRTEQPDNSRSKKVDIVQVIKDACQPRLTAKIIGEPAESDEFPWMAALGYLISTQNYRVNFNCAGTIISNYFVLTAAHCVKPKRPILVRLGKVSLIDSYDDEIKSVNYYIKDIISHHNYSSITNVNDIALIRVENEIEFSRYIIPACLQTDLRDEPLDVTLIVTGWGLTSYEQRTRSFSLHKAHLTSMPLSECNKTLLDWNRTQNNRKLRNGLIDGQYCAYDPKKREDACSGDSGGPLQYFQTNRSMTSTVVGIVSYGLVCGWSNLPGVYTRVALYADWIQPIVWPNA